MRRIGPLTSLILSCLLAGCATLDKSQCREADWRAVGFEDGAAGRSVSRIARHRQACAEYGVTPDLARYRRGHAEGARQYCRPANGFHQARAGQDYNGLCPADLEGEFLAAWATGRQLYQLDTEIDRLRRDAAGMAADLQGLQQRRDNLEAALATGGLSVRDRKHMREQHRELQSRIALIEADIRRFEFEAARLQGRYDYLNASHPY